MKCKKCGNEYPSNYYFATDDICRECFSKMDENEKQSILSQSYTDANQSYPPVYYRVGFATRLGAAVIDWIIFGMITLIVLYITGFFDVYLDFIDSISGDLSNLMLMSEQFEKFVIDNMLYFLFLTILKLVYYSLEVLVGGSLGKLILGIRIANADRTIGNTKILLNRFLIKHSDTVFNILATITLFSFLDLLSIIAGVVIIIGCFFVLGDQRLALHDMIAKTAVYYKYQILEDNQSSINKNKMQP